MAGQRLGIDLVDAAPPKPHPAAIDDHRREKPLGVMLQSRCDKALRHGAQRLAADKPDQTHQHDQGHYQTQLQPAFQGLHFSSGTKI